MESSDSAQDTRTEPVTTATLSLAEVGRLADQYTADSTFVLYRERKARIPFSATAPI
jgi:hypothetical protein